MILFSAVGTNQKNLLLENLGKFNFFSPTPHQ